MPIDFPKKRAYHGAGSGCLTLNTTVVGFPSPTNIAVNPVTNKIYVTHFGDKTFPGNTVTVINGKTNTKDEVIVGNNPEFLAINSVTNRIYVANRFSNTVTLIDGAKNTTTAIPVGQSPHKIIVNQVTNKIYVINNDSNSITVIDGDSNATMTLPTGANPSDIDVNTITNKIYVTNENDGSVTVITGTTNVVEFYNTNLDNFFITANSAEGTAIDNGSAGPGWVRTGNKFISGGNSSVCRFYGSQSPGPNSHFFTVDGAECDNLKQIQANTSPSQKRWNFESLDFLTTAPINGNCPSGTVPVYRAYNNGFSRGVDSNHRITTSLPAIQEVVARGWSNEGVVMCSQI